MTNGHDKEPVELIKPHLPNISDAQIVKTCHRFYAPVVFPEPSKADPRQATITPRLGNFPCIQDQCMLWNTEKSECWDVSAARGHALSGDYAYARLNDVHLDTGRGD